MARAATSAWTGAVSFGGFPVSLRAYTLIESRSAKSFKSLCECHHQPVKMPKRCPVDDVELAASQILKGHQTGKDTYAVVPPEAAEQLRSTEATRVLTIEGLPPLASIDHYRRLATNHYRLVPDPDVAGSDQPAQILWNGLRASDRALVTEWVPRAGSRDGLLVITADSFGLTGDALPYKSELKSTPEWKPVESEQVGATFEPFAQMNGISLDEFHFDQFESSYEKRRAAAIEAALSGKPIEIPAEAKPAAATPDLMAAMQAAIAAQAPKKAARKTPTKATKAKV